MEDIRDECGLSDKAPGGSEVQENASLEDTGDGGLEEPSPEDVACDIAVLKIEHAGADDSAEMMLAYEKKWYREYLRRLPPRRPMLTTTGFVGLAPEHVEPGDQVFVLLGGTTPFVLRPVDGGDRYTLVGDAYVHGIMYGEMTKGEPEIVDVTIV